MKEGTLYVARHLPSDFAERTTQQIETQTDTYDRQKQHIARL